MFRVPVPLCLDPPGLARDLGRGPVGAQLITAVPTWAVGRRRRRGQVFANHVQPGNAAVTTRRPGQKFADIADAYSGVRSRYHALLATFEWRLRGGSRLPAAPTSSQANDSGARSLENPNGHYPAPQDFFDMDAESRSLRVRPALQPHPQCLLGPAVRRAALRGWQFAGIDARCGGPGDRLSRPGADVASQS